MKGAVELGLPKIPLDVFHSTDCFRDSVRIPHNTTGIGMKVVPPYGGNEVFTVFYRKHDMVMAGEVGRGHGGGFQRPCRGAMFVISQSGGLRRRIE